MSSTLPDAAPTPSAQLASAPDEHAASADDEARERARGRGSADR
ncbi:MAG: hypothetical protein AB7S26_21875 [Sandaracinaceae bacterium]